MKNITKLTLDTVRVIEQNNQVTYWRKATGVPQECAAWVMTQELNRKQQDEIAQEMCYLERRRENTTQELSEGSLVYSCDVKSFAWIAIFSLIVFEVLSWILIAGHNHGYWTAHGYAFAFIAGINILARFVVVPMIDAWHNWRDAANKAGRLG